MDVERAKETISTHVPRQLRLDELLGELGARMPVPVPVPMPMPVPVPVPMPVPTTDADPLPMPLPLRLEKIAVDDLIVKAAESGFGFIIGVLSLIAIPFVGLSTPFGLAMAVLGAEMAIGRREPWLPARVRRRALSFTMLDRVLALLRKRARWLATATRRRWELLIIPRVIGLMIVLLALGLALPLPIPGSNLVFLIPLFVYSIGLLERDGVWVMIGHVLTAIDMALLIVFGKTVLLVLARIWSCAAC